MANSRVEPQIAIGRRIATVREAHGLTQRALGQHLNVTQTAVGKWETGDRVPSRAMQFQLAAVLKCRRDDLFKEFAEQERAWEATA